MNPDLILLKKTMWNVFRTPILIFVVIPLCTMAMFGWFITDFCDWVSEYILSWLQQEVGPNGQLCTPDGLKTEKPNG